MQKSICFDCCRGHVLIFQRCVVMLAVQRFKPLPFICVPLKIKTDFICPRFLSFFKLMHIDCQTFSGSSFSSSHFCLEHLCLSLLFDFLHIVSSCCLHLLKVCRNHFWVSYVWQKSLLQVHLFTLTFMVHIFFDTMYKYLIDINSMIFFKHQY